MEEQRRGRNVALAGAVLQVIFTVVVLIIWQWTGSVSAMAVTLTVAGGTVLWLVVALLFYGRQLARREELELADLAARGGGAGTSIFEHPEGAQAKPARQRLALLERWIMPVFTLLWAGYHVAIGALVLRYLTRLETPAKLTSFGGGTLFLVLVWFVAFLFSRYCTGMAQQVDWRPLRAAGSYLLINDLFVVAIIAGLLSAWQGYPRVDLAVAHVIPVLQLVLAVELVLSFILDLYRPRVPGEERRLSFDSRLLNLAAEPARIGHSIAETLNYQFGFEVSKTWFYQLLSKALVPLLFFAVAVLFVMSCIVIVPDGQQAVVLHWGKADPQRGALGPGLYWKWPWPIDTARHFRVDSVHQIFAGAGAERTEAERAANVIKGRELFLWTREHGERKELDFILAVPPRTRQTPKGAEDKTPPVNVIKLVVLVQYQITDVYDYGFKYTQAKKMLECIAFRQMVRYCASATLHEPVGAGESDRPEAIMTYGRERAAQELKRRIQDEANALGLGVRITMAGLLTIHPPADAAAAFEEVLEAERRQDEARYKAEGEANEILAKVAGRPAEALELALAIRVLEDLEILRQARNNPAEFQSKIDRAIQAVRKDLVLLDKEIQRARLLGKLGEGGSEATAQRLRDEHLRHLRALEEIRKDPKGFDFDGRIEGKEGARTAANDLFKAAVGEPAELVAKAEAVRWETELAERARYESIQRQRLAWQANPYVYQWDRWLDVWDEVLPNIRKYVLAVDKDLIEIWLNWEREEPPTVGMDYSGRTGQGSE